MPTAFDGTKVPESISIPCGGETHFDEDSGYSYRCWSCMAIVGSVGMPSRCKQLMDENVTSEEELFKKRLGFEYVQFKEEV